MSAATTREPAPTSRPESRAVVPWVVDYLGRHYADRDALARDLLARAEQGVAKYGVPLATHNGRRARVDAYQEALDLVAYAAQDDMEQGGTNETRVTLQMAVQLAERLRRALDDHGTGHGPRRTA